MMGLQLRNKKQRSSQYPFKSDLHPETQVDCIDVDYRIELITEQSGLKKIEKDWQRLYEQTAKGKPNKIFLFQSPHWQKVWIDTFNPEQLLVIVVYNQQNQCQALAPLMIQKSRQGLLKKALKVLRFIGNEPCLYDEMNILLAEDCDKAACVQKIAETINDYKSDWDAIELNYGSDIETFNTLQTVLMKDTPRSEIELQNIHALVHLNNCDFESYLKAHKRGAKKYKRHCKKLERDFPERILSMKVLTRENPEFERYKQDLIEKHKSYWKQHQVTSVFSRHPEAADFYNKLSGESAYLSALVLDDTVISYDMGIIHAGGYSCQIMWYHPEYSKYSPGTVHLGMMIKNRIEAGDEMYSLGMGDIEYKARWEDERHQLYQFRATKNIFAAACIYFDEILINLKDKIWRR